MKFDEFIEEVKKKASLRYPKMEVSVREIVKNNGLLLHGFTMTDKSESAFISPTLYMEDFFNRFEKNGELDHSDFENVTERIFSVYDDALSSVGIHSNIPDMLKNTEYLRSNSYMTIVNKKLNEELLKDCPHRDFYDLAIIYRVHVGFDSDSVGSVLIKNKFLEYMGMSEEELYHVAYKNTKELFGSSVLSMRDVLRKMMGNSSFPLEEYDYIMPMYVISNSTNVNGAVNMLYDENLATISQKVGGDLIVLPSSVHEVICVPASMNIPNEMRCMVCDVNDSQIAPDERLSDNIYMYDAERHLLSDEATYNKNHSDKVSDEVDNEKIFTHNSVRNR